jgi:hypothetical protein
VFLSRALFKVNNLHEEQFKMIENNFKKSMIAAFEIFGTNAFRKISHNQKRLYPINKALFECWSVTLSQLKEEQITVLKQRKQNLIEKFIYYVDNDPDFLASISQAADKIEYRFRRIEQIIKEVRA